MEDFGQSYQHKKFSRKRRLSSICADSEELKQFAASSDQDAVTAKRFQHFHIAEYGKAAASVAELKRELPSLDCKQQEVSSFDCSATNIEQNPLKHLLFLIRSTQRRLRNI